MTSECDDVILGVRNLVDKLEKKIKEQEEQINTLKKQQSNVELEKKIKEQQEQICVLKALL
jgi:hypothetical protein